jgi:hypothetical protein
MQINPVLYCLGNNVEEWGMNRFSTDKAVFSKYFASTVALTDEGWLYIYLIRTKIWMT